MKKYKCRFCNEEFEFEKTQQFAAHSSNCKCNPNVVSKTKSIKVSKQRKGVKRTCGSLAKEHVVYCQKCSKEYIVKVTYEKLTEGKYKKHCSRQCANSRVKSDEVKLKQSISSKNSKKVKFANAQPRQYKNSDTTSICLACGELIYHKSYNLKKYHRECWLKQSGGFQINSTIKHRSVYNGFQMDSGAEKVFAMLLDENNIKWVKNSTQFFEYVNKKGKNSKYYPDFYLEEHNKWVEVKGKFYADKDENLELKLEAVPNIQIIYSGELSKCKKNIKSLLRIGGNCTLD